MLWDDFPYFRSLIRLLLPVVEDSDIIQAPQWVTERGGLLIACLELIQQLQ